jgi:MFS family permease
LAAALVAIVTAIATEAMAVSTILPVVRDDLGGLGWYGWVFSGFALAQLVSIPITGRWLDRVEAWKPMVVGLVVFVVGLAASALAPSMPVLVAGRVLQGLGGGAAPAVAYVCVGRGFPEADRPKIFALMSTAWVLPSVLSPAFASVVAHYVGWRWVFGGLIPVVILVGLLAVGPVRAVTPPAVEDRPRGLMWAPPLVAFGAAGFLTAVDLRSPALGTLVGLGGLAVAAIGLSQLTPPGTLRGAPGLPTAVAGRGLLTFSFFATDAFLSLAITDVRGRSTLYAGAVLAVASFTWTAGSWLQARLVARTGPRPLAVGGFLVLAAGVALMVTVVATELSTSWAFVGSSVMGLGIGTAYAPQSLVVLAGADRGSEGFSVAGLQLTDTLGVAVGPGIAGVIVATADRWDQGVRSGLIVAWTVAAVVAVAGSLVSRRLPAPGVR